MCLALELLVSSLYTSLEYFLWLFAQWLSLSDQCKLALESCLWALSLGPNVYYSSSPFQSCKKFQNEWSHVSLSSVLLVISGSTCRSTPSVGFALSDSYSWLSIPLDVLSIDFLKLFSLLSSFLPHYP